MLVFSDSPNFLLNFLQFHREDWPLLLIHDYVFLINLWSNDYHELWKSTLQHHNYLLVTLVCRNTSGKPIMPHALHALMWYCFLFRDVYIFFFLLVHAHHLKITTHWPPHLAFCFSLVFVYSTIFFNLAIIFIFQNSCPRALVSSFCRSWILMGFAYCVSTSGIFLLPMSSSSLLFCYFQHLFHGQFL